MKDHENLTQHNIKDGLTVHLVIKSPRSATSPNNQDAPPPRPAGMQLINHASSKIACNCNNFYINHF